MHDVEWRPHNNNAPRTAVVYIDMLKSGPRNGQQEILSINNMLTITRRPLTSTATYVRVRTINVRWVVFLWCRLVWLYFINSGRVRHKHGDNRKEKGEKCRWLSVSLTAVYGIGGGGKRPLLRDPRTRVVMYGHNVNIYLVHDWCRNFENKSNFSY